MNDFNLLNCYDEAKDIVKYIVRFCDFDSSLIHSIWANNLEIEISEEEPYKKYKGKYSDKDIIKIIENNMPQNKIAADYCKRLISCLREYREWPCNNPLNNLLDELKGLLENEKLSPFDVDKVKRIIKSFKERDVFTFTLGQYYPSKRKIVLYKQNIIKTSFGDVYSNMKRVLVHEMFHAIHHFLFDGAKKVRTKFKAVNQQSCIVIEGLARFVEYNYCKDNSYLLGNYCDVLKNSWDNHFFETYPYSAAKYIEEYSEDKVALIHRLIADSKKDFIDAYHDIVYLYKLNAGFDEVLKDDKYNSYRYDKQYISGAKKSYIIDYITNNHDHYSGSNPEVFGNDNNRIEELAPNNFFLLTSDIKKAISSNRKNFSDLLYEKINDRNINNTKCYQDARLNKDAFYKILRNETNPKPETVAQLAISLKLNSKEYEEFINAAGYSRKYKTTDPLSIIGVYIDHNEYDWDDIENSFLELTGHPLVNYDGRRTNIIY